MVFFQLAVLDTTKTQEMSDTRKLASLRPLISRAYLILPIFGGSTFALNILVFYFLYHPQIAGTVLQLLLLEEHLVFLHHKNGVQISEIQE